MKSWCYENMRDEQYKVYLVEDDEMLADEIQKLFEKWDYEVFAAKDFDKILDEYIMVKPHVVLMDVNVPSFDGFYWCRKIRELSDVPIIYMSSRDSSMDIIMGMSSGGDDYITKPFDNDVLIAKIQAIIRRTYEYSIKESHVLKCNGLILNIEEVSASYEGNVIDLTKNELKILKVLMENQGKVVTRQALMKTLWDDEIYVNENTLTINVNRVRQRLDGVGLKDFIWTKKGMGYMIL